MQQEPNKMKPNQKDELEKKTDNEFVRKFAEEKYKYGFTTEVHTDIIERGLNEDVIRLISSKKDEPGVVAGVSTESVSPLADAGNAYLGTSPYP